jgi:hypothetical protein
MTKKRNLDPQQTSAPSPFHPTPGDANTGSPVSPKTCKWGCGRVVEKQRRECTTCRTRLGRGVEVKDLAAPVRPTRVVTPGDTHPTLADRIRAYLVKGKLTSASVEELADRFDRSPHSISVALDELGASGVNIQILSDSRVQIPTDLPHNRAESRIDIGKFRGDWIRFGLTGDNHLCSKYARLDVLNALYDHWEHEGITRVLQAGNMIDGEARFNKFDLLTRPGIDAQAEYLVNEWPYRAGITTEFVCGDDHEGWYVQREGINIVTYLQNAADKAKRFDLKFMGYMEHDYSFRGSDHNSVMRVIHAGGGSAYATSYSVQKIVESYQPNEKPTILIVGHYHKAEYSYPRAVHVVQVGCTQDQTPFLRKRRIEAMIGGWTIGFQVDQSGIVHRFHQEWQPFYDRDFYNKWGYAWK